jgi:hypothetical protein
LFFLAILWDTTNMYDLFDSYLRIPPW